MRKLQEITLSYEDGKTFTAFCREDGIWQIQPESMQMTTQRHADAPDQLRESDLLLEVATAIGVSTGAVQPVQA